jgi:hypothetical protein
MNSALNIVKKFFPAVTKVVDATTDTIIEVTNHDAKSSKKRDHNSCAFAVACKHKFTADGVIVSLSKAYIINGKKATRYTIPESVSREIVAFDRDGSFEPGEYKLNKPSKFQKLGSQYGGNDYAPGNGKKKRGFVHHTGGIRTVLGSKELS